MWLLAITSRSDIGMTASSPNFVADFDFDVSAVNFRAVGVSFLAQGTFPRPRIG
jgi:hypothetical protein